MQHLPDRGGWMTRLSQRSAVDPSRCADAPHRSAPERQCPAASESDEDDWNDRPPTANECRSASEASSYRCHQRCAVAGETFSDAAACLNVIPPSIASQRASRPAGPSFALPWICIRVLLGRELFADPQPGMRPDASSTVHNVCRHVTLVRSTRLERRALPAPTRSAPRRSSRGAGSWTTIVPSHDPTNWP